MIFSAVDHGMMARALQLAERGLWTTSPNPRVGCVLVRDGEVVGELRGTGATGAGVQQGELFVFASHGGVRCRPARGTP